MAKKTAAPVLNENYGAPRTVGELADVLASFPRNAEVVMESFNECDRTLFDGLSGLRGVNLTKRGGRKLIQNDEGPINTVIFGCWHEGRTQVELGPKQQAAEDAEFAELYKDELKEAAAK